MTDIVIPTIGDQPIERKAALNATKCTVCKNNINKRALKHGCTECGKCRQVIKRTYCTHVYKNGQYCLDLGMVPHTHCFTCDDYLCMCGACPTCYPGTIDCDHIYY